jgi:signal transduction histidine kinase
MENIILQYHERGVVVNDVKRNEIEILLKNSQFSATMLLNLINDLLDMAKMEAHQINLSWNYFDLFDVIERSAETLDSQLAQKQIKMQHTYQEEERKFMKRIYGDSHRYLQILLNFLSNAVKFTPEKGQITVQTILKDKQLV